MLVYLFMLAVSLIFAVQASRAKRYPALRVTFLIYAWGSVLPFVVITAIRYRIGTDWYIYESYFGYIKNHINKFEEEGFNLIFRIFGIFTDEAWYAIAFVGVVTVIFFFCAIYQQSMMIPLSVLLFFVTGKYFNTLNQMRQMMAMAVFMFSLKYVYQRRLMPFLFLNLLGSTLHLSSLMYLPLYFMYGKSFSAKTCMKLFAGSIILFPVLKKVMPFVLSFTRYSWYFDSEYATNDFYLTGFVFNLLIMLLHLWVLYIRGTEEKNFRL